jgi:hypothetical protein
MMKECRRMQNEAWIGTEQMKAQLKKGYKPSSQIRVASQRKVAIYPEKGPCLWK